MIGASLGGLIAAGGVGPQAHLAGAAAVFLGIGLASASHLPEAQRLHTGDLHSSPKRRMLSLPPVLLILAVIGFFMFLSEGAIADWSGVYFRQALGASAGIAAAGYAVFSAGMALFRLLGDAITSRLGHVRTLRGAALVAAGGLSLALTTHSIHWVLLGFGVTGAGLSVIVPLVFGAGGRIKSVASGTGIALVSGSGYIGFLFGPPLIGLVAQRGSLQGALFILVALTLVTASLAPAVRPR
jgi:MFS family permease